jgi:hypothetical protein
MGRAVRRCALISAFCSFITAHRPYASPSLACIASGVATETFALSGDGGRTLTVDTTMSFKARPGSFAYRTVYHRG